MDPEFLLIKRMKQGDEKAFDIFVRKYYDDILAYCGHHLRGRQQAEDMTQETFLRFFSGLADYRYMGKTKNYLYTIAGNLCRDIYRKKEELPGIDETVAGALHEYAASYRDHEGDRLESLKAAVDMLPPELREVVILHYFQDLKIKDTAKILGITVSLTKYRLGKARENLRKSMEKEEE